jgi:hypothetical protein
VKRKIFPALLSRSERRALTKLSTKSRCSESAVVRGLIRDAGLSAMCRTLIQELVGDTTFPHRRLLIRESKHFIKEKGGVQGLERLLRREQL